MKTGKYHWVTERPLKLGKKEGLWADNSKSKAQASRGPQHVNNHRHLDQISHGFPSHPSSETGTLLCMQFKACLRLGTLLSHWVLASQVCRYTLISTIFIVVFLFPCSSPPPFYFIYGFFFIFVCLFSWLFGFLFCFYFFCQDACLCTTCMQRPQRRVSVPLDLKLWVVVSCSVGDGNWTRFSVRAATVLNH